LSGDFARQSAKSLITLESSANNAA